VGQDFEVTRERIRQIEAKASASLATQPLEAPQGVHRKLIVSKHLRAAMILIAALSFPRAAGRIFLSAPFDLSGKEIAVAMRIDGRNVGRVPIRGASGGASRFRVRPIQMSRVRSF